MLRRRNFVGLAGGAAAAALLATHAPGWAQGVSRRADGASDRVLVLVELKGGNDGLNTLVPYADPAYAPLRGALAIPREQVQQLDGRVGLHPELRPLMPLWEKKELAVVQGVGYPQPNLSHFRSIAIWETASASTEYLEEGWVARALRGQGAGRTAYTADGVMVGGGGMGPLSGSRSVALTNPEAFIAQSRFATAPWAQGTPALQHVLRVESDVTQAADGLRGERFPFATVFPQGAFGNAVRVAAQVAATQRGKGGVPVIVVSLGSFDTHQNQLGNHANLLRQLGEGVSALKGAMTELGLWDRTLVMTFSEFGRRARANQSNGTDHGTASVQFAAGGAVRGGLYGNAPSLERLDGAGNLVHTTDFRQLYATVARDWWGVNPESVVRGRFEPVGFLRS